VAASGDDDEEDRLIVRLFQMNELTERAEIKRYVDKAYQAKMMQMNDVRRNRNGDLCASLADKGHSRNSSACLLGEVDIEEACIAELLHQKADLYIDAYQRKGLKIGPDVLKDVSDSHVELIATRKSTLMAQSQLTAVPTNRPSRANFYAHLGKKASQAMKEIEAKIDLYNLTPKRANPTTIMNITYHLSGSGNRVVHGDDNSVNIINEKELFDGLAAVITRAVQDETQREEILGHLEELKRQTTKTDYLATVPKFIAAASSIGHLIAPYLPALIEKAQSLHS
jgi:hypothetical protein